MTVLALCHICGRPAASSCRSCGLVTCMDHLSTESGVCTKCAAGRMGGFPGTDRGKGRPPPDYLTR